MDDTITIAGGSGTDSLTTSDTITLDLGGYGAAQSTWGSTPLTAISIDDILPTASVTLPSTYSITSGGTGTTSWSSSGINYTYNTMPNSVHINADGLTMKEGADIKIGSKSLTEAIEKIEERLGILNPNPALEDRWEKLKELRNQYIELEKDLLEKEKIMKILKET